MPKRRRPRMLLVVNPRASSYSADDERTVASELRAAFDVELARTETPGHATDLSREAADARMCDVVAVLGGDGAVNEVVNGLAGTDVPLAPLPGGRTNVFCRILGVSEKPGPAAAAVAEVARGWGRGAAPDADVEGPERLPTRRVDLGVMNGRHFTFASGIGLSAVANHRLNSHGIPGQRLGGIVFAAEALATAASYARTPPRLVVEVAGAEAAVVEGNSLVAQNADPLTYFGRRALPLCEGAGLETGRLSLAVVRRLTALAAVRVASAVVLGRGRRALELDEIASLPAVAEARVRPLDDRPLPVEVDGEFVGDLESVLYRAAPHALSVVGTRGSGAG